MKIRESSLLQAWPFGFRVLARETIGSRLRDIYEILYTLPLSPLLDNDSFLGQHAPTYLIRPRLGQWVSAQTLTSSTILNAALGAFPATYMPLTAVLNFHRSRKNIYRSVIRRLKAHPSPSYKAEHNIFLLCRCRIHESCVCNIDPGSRRDKKSHILSPRHGRGQWRLCPLQVVYIKKEKKEKEKCRTPYMGLPRGK